MNITVKPSKDFIKTLKELSGLKDAPHNIKKRISSQKDLELTTQEIKWCHNKIQERGMPQRIHTLLNQSQIIIPNYEEPKRSPELEARIKLLEAQQANKEYKKMTENIIVNQFEAASLKGASFSDVGKEMRELNRQLITGMQYLISVVGTFFAIFVASGFVVPDDGVRVLWATIAAVIVALAEIYFVIREDIASEERLQLKNK